MRQTIRMVIEPPGRSIPLLWLHLSDHQLKNANWEYEFCSLDEINADKIGVPQPNIRHKEYIMEMYIMERIALECLDVSNVFDLIKPGDGYANIEVVLQVFDSQ